MWMFYLLIIVFLYNDKYRLVWWCKVFSEGRSDDSFNWMIVCKKKKKSSSNSPDLWPDTIRDTAGVKDLISHQLLQKKKISRDLLHYVIMAICGSSISFMIKKVDGFRVFIVMTLLKRLLYEEISLIATPLLCLCRETVFEVDNVYNLTWLLLQFLLLRAVLCRLLLTTTK